MLHREDGHWTVTPNQQRYSQGIDNLPDGDTRTTVATISKDTIHWLRIFTFPNLEELTLHEASPEQLISVGEKLRSLKRLRITHARPRNLHFLHGIASVEELVLEYVSGIDDLSPLRELKKLRSLHLENLRRVSSFAGLSGILSLRYLAIHGTLDWKQPIKDFEFLRNLPNLEFLDLFQVITKAQFPALLPAIHLKKLKKINIAWRYFDAREFALLEEALPGVSGATWGAYREWSGSDRVPWIEFTGKGAGRVKQGSAAAKTRCREYAEKYAAMKAEARRIIDKHATT